MSEGIRSMEQALGEVRRATPDDAAAIVDIQYRAWMDAYLPIVEDLTEADVKERFHYDAVNGLKEHSETARERISDPASNTQTFVHSSVKAESPDGYIVTGNQDGEKAILALYVDPTAQSKGVGSRLIGEALRYLQADINEVELGV